MRYFETILLKDGRKCILRNGTPADAQAVLEVFQLTHGETDFLLSYPDENAFDLTGEEAFLRKLEESENELELLALSFDGSLPRFRENAKRQSIDRQELTVYYDDQCPFIPDRVEKLRRFCAETEIPAEFIHVQSLKQAKNLPCVFNNWAVFYGGKFVTVNQLDAAGIEKLLKKK